MNATATSQLRLRLPTPMKEWLTARALANYRSINAEVLAAIQRAIDSESTAPKNSSRRPRRVQP